MSVPTKREISLANKVAKLEAQITALKGKIVIASVTFKAFKANLAENNAAAKAKLVAKPIAKPVAKPAAKPVAKPAAKPAAKKASK